LTYALKIKKMKAHTCGRRKYGNAHVKVHERDGTPMWENEGEKECA